MRRNGTRHEARRAVAALSAVAPVLLALAAFADSALGQIPVPGGANDSTKNFAGSCDGQLTSTPASSTTHVQFGFKNKSGSPVDQGPQQWTGYYLQP